MQILQALEDERVSSGWTMTRSSKSSCKLWSSDKRSLCFSILRRSIFIHQKYTVSLWSCSSTGHCLKFWTDSNRWHKFMLLKCLMQAWSDRVSCINIWLITNSLRSVELKCAISGFSIYFCDSLILLQRRQIVFSFLLCRLTTQSATIVSMRCRFV